MLSKTPRPSSTAATMVAKLSSVRVIAAASFVTSVPVSPIAMPMSAFFRAGASFTPSPVMATTCWFACRAATTRSLCAGETRAYTSMVSASRTSWSSDMASSSVPTTTRPLRSRPSSRATAVAVTGWSPVIITGRMPARSQTAIASRASVRGGSIIPTSPSRVIPSAPDSSSVSAFVATASTRSASHANAWATSTSAARPGSSRAWTPSTVATAAQPGRTFSGAPLVQAKVPSTVRCRVVIRLLSEVNGISWRRGAAAVRSCWSRPALAAATTSAPSVGSPVMVHPPSERCSSASLARTAARSSPSSAGLGGAVLP